jgi:hypothetical protein
VSHAARSVACRGVRSHAVPVALVGECSIPGRVEGPVFIVPRELEIAALGATLRLRTRHAPQAAAGGGKSFTMNARLASKPHSRSMARRSSV